MDNYERTIGMKTIGLTIVRRFLVILIIFIPVALATFIYTKYGITKTYQSSATMFKSSNFNAAQYENFKAGVKNSVEAAKSYLDENNITHANGKEITIDEINAGLTYSALSTTSPSVNINFQSTDSSIPQNVLKAVTEQALATLNTGTGDFATLKFSKEATAAVKNSSENKYLIIGVALGAVLALGFAFIDEIVSDEVYDKKDVEQLGCSGFYINTNAR